MADNTLPQPRDAIGLCLSGGGFRAMLFHIGALWRLNEFGYLPKLDRISSVSGGSIAAGWLGFRWKDLKFDDKGAATNFIDVYVEPLRTYARQKVDVSVVLGGMVNPFQSIGQLVAQSYRKHLFGSATLQDLPDYPRFVINASNAGSGVLWRFSKPYMADYRVGLVRNPAVELAVAVAASSAFPPILSPVIVPLNPADFEADSGVDLQKPPYTNKAVLLDGGVYDNLGLETVFKNHSTVLISDAGGKMTADPKPKLFWGLQAFRVLNMLDNQVRALRKRDIVDLYKLRSQLTEYWQEQGQEPDEELLNSVSRKGTYWGSFSDIRNYKLDDAMDCPEEKTLKLARLATRLWTFSDVDQQRLINWGYAICDAAMRKHVDSELPANPKFPYPGGVG